MIDTQQVSSEVVEIKGVTLNEREDGTRYVSIWVRLACGHDAHIFQTTPTALYPNCKQHTICYHCTYPR